MIHELRTYDVEPECLATYLQLWADVGIAARGSGQYGQLLGFWISDSGSLNQATRFSPPLMSR